MEKLRTPDERFAHLPGWPFAPRYVEVPDGDGGRLRVHYVDEGSASASPIVLFHGGKADPVLGFFDVIFQEHVPGAKGQPYRVFPNGTHFIQEQEAPALVEILTEVARD